MADLPKLRKNDWRKRLIGHLIEKRTGVPQRWIGEHLIMGNESHVSRLCSRIDDLAKQMQITKYLKEIETRTRKNKDMTSIFPRSAITEFARQTGIRKTRADFDHFDCCPEAWLENGKLGGYLKGDSHDNHFYLKPWYFIYDANHDKFVPHDSPGKQRRGCPGAAMIEPPHFPNAVRDPTRRL